jgi:hypothetical protein
MRITSILIGLLIAAPMGAGAPSPLAPHALEKINNALVAPVLSSAEGPAPSQHITLPTTPTVQPLSSIITQKRLTACINIAAVAYASYEIYFYYKKLYYPPRHKPSLREKIASTITPIFIRDMHKHHKLFWYSLGATVRALIYKAIAQFMVVCATKTIGDVLTIAVQKLNGMIKQPSMRIWY